MRCAWILLLLLALPAYAGDEHSGCPLHKEHQQSALDQRGDAVMGFSQQKATHHFLITDNGGTISVDANDATDQETIAEIHMHLQMVTKQFASGDFQMAHAIHLQDPPGTQTMRDLKDEIRYEYEETDQGARVKIQTTNADAIAAIHDFLRFQIAEHKTGDPEHTE